MAEALIIGSSLLAGLGHALAAYLGWYWNPRFDWIDMALHFFGGLLVASFAWWVGGKWPSFNVFHNNFFKDLIIFLAIAALVGLGWEFLEFGYDYYFLPAERFQYLNFAQISKSDTMGDLFFDLLGALAAALILSFKKR